MWRKTAIHELAKAHPRSRGEHIERAEEGEEVGGSSPLARGTSRLILAVLVLARLIPARAGNMLKNGLEVVASTAHPRSRGEHVSSRIRNNAVSGSSPLARGTLRESRG